MFVGSMIFSGHKPGVVAVQHLMHQGYTDGRMIFALRCRTGFDMQFKRELNCQQRTFQSREIYDETDSGEEFIGSNVRVSRRITEHNLLTLLQDQDLMPDFKVESDNENKNPDGHCIILGKVGDPDKGFIILTSAEGQICFVERSKSGLSYEYKLLRLSMDTIQKGFDSARSILEST